MFAEHLVRSRDPLRYPLCTDGVTDPPTDASNFIEDMDALGANEGMAHRQSPLTHTGGLSPVCPTPEPC